MRFASFLFCLLLAFGLAPLGVFAAPDDEDKAEESENITVEYRYSEGETVDVPDTITQFGRTYKLIDKAEPVLESTLPITRTYTYRINGLLSEEDLASIRDIPGLVLTPVAVEAEREVNKTLVIPDLASNDVDQPSLPEYQAFEVTSSIAEGGTSQATLKRAAVHFKVTEEVSGLPTKYEATAIYRGIETYREGGYYQAAMTYQRSETEGDTPQYVIVATYEPENPQRDDTDTEIDPGLEPESEIDIRDAAREQSIPVIFGVPLVTPAGFDAWALADLILMGVAILVAIIAIVRFVLLRRREEDEDSFDYVASDERNVAKGRNVWFGSAIVLAIVSILIFALTQDLSLFMVLLDIWSVVLAVILAIEFLAIKFTFRIVRKERKIVAEV